MAFLRRKFHFPTTYWVINHVEYHWEGWFGCQLKSYQWFMPKLLETRTLDLCDGEPKLTFEVFSAKRKGLRVEIGWALVRGSESYNGYGERIESLRQRLRRIH